MGPNSLVVVYVDPPPIFCKPMSKCESGFDPVPASGLYDAADSEMLALWLQD